MNYIICICFYVNNNNSFGSPIKTDQLTMNVTLLESVHNSDSDTSSITEKPRKSPKEIWKDKHPESDVPESMGKKWTPEEIKQLLSHIQSGVTIEIIAGNHKRSEGGIRSKLRGIAYDMYCKDLPMEEITMKTGVSSADVMDTVYRKNNLMEKKKIPIKLPEVNNVSSMEDRNSETIQNVYVEVQTMKTEMRELKNNVKELIELLQAIYEFGEE